MTVIYVLFGIIDGIASLIGRRNYHFELYKLHPNVNIAENTHRKITIRKFKFSILVKLSIKGVFAFGILFGKLDEIIHHDIH